MFGLVSLHLYINMVTWSLCFRSVFHIRMAPPSPFTEMEQLLILEFGAVMSIIHARRNLRKAFKMAPNKVPPMPHGWLPEAGENVPDQGGSEPHLAHRPTLHQLVYLPG